MVFDMVLKLLAQKKPDQSPVEWSKIATSLKECKEKGGRGGAGRNDEL
jgi:hypothetical protein